MKKNVFRIIAFLAAIYVAELVFNHVNAWAGIAIVFVASFIALEWLINKLNK